MGREVHQIRDVSGGLCQPPSPPALWPAAIRAPVTANLNIPPHDGRVSYMTQPGELLITKPYTSQTSYMSHLEGTAPHKANQGALDPHFRVLIWVAALNQSEPFTVVFNYARCYITNAWCYCTNKLTTLLDKYLARRTYV